MTLDAETKALLAEELEDIALELAMLSQEQATTEGVAPLLFQQIHAEIERLGDTAEMYESEAIMHVAAWVLDNVNALKTHPARLEQQHEQGHYYVWIELIATLLREEEIDVQAELLTELNLNLQQSTWSIAIDHALIHRLFSSLSLAPLSDALITSLSATHTVTPQDEQNDNDNNNDKASYRLAWDEDIHPELLEAFFIETPDLVTETAALMRTISTGNADQATHQKAARLAHTIKGSSAVVGIEAIANFAHKLEDILEHSIESALPPAAAECFIEAADCLEAMFDSLQARTTPPPQYPSLLAQLEDWDKKIKTGEITTIVSDGAAPQQTVIERPIETRAAKAKQVAETEHISKPVSKPAITPLDTIATKAEQEKPTKKIAFKLPPMREMQLPFIPPKITQATLTTPSVNLNEATLRVPISLIEKLLNFSNELITSNTQLAEYTQTLHNDKRTMHQRNERICNLVDELEWAVSRQSSPLHTQQTRPTEFDALEMDNYNALHSITSLLAETTNDDRETSLALIKQFNRLKERVIEQQKINKALNTSILAMRMEPITLITPRLERIVRETCRETHKKADFTITGDNLALDTDVLKGLLDPLLHLLRNAIDHGIETPEMRQHHDKPPTGKITLHVNQQGDHVLLSLKDDGAGIDAEAIYQKAIKKGLIKADTPLTDDEKIQLIVHAGLSTRQTISKVSGRGVGMDVVNSAINDLSGSLRINSKKGVGTEIQLHVPLTLVAVNVLLVELAGHILAIPSTSIQQIHYLEEGTIQHKKEHYFIHFDDKKIPLLSLSALLDWTLTPFNNQIAQPIVIIKHNKMQYAFYFDQVINFQEIVLKTLKPWMTKTQGVNGVCLLQNGVVAPVLHLTELLTDIPQHAFHIQTATNDTNIAKAPHSRRILVVDDSLSNRKALSLTIEPLGYDVSTAIDGTDAITHLEKTTFGLVITDLEMPTMNGLQLSAYIRGQPDIQHYPIVMVTSRSTEKHRALAKKAGVNDYLTKPVNKATLKACIEKFIPIEHH